MFIRTATINYAEYTELKYIIQQRKCYVCGYAKYYANIMFIPV